MQQISPAPKIYPAFYLLRSFVSSSSFSRSFPAPRFKRDSDSFSQSTGKNSITKTPELLCLRKKTSLQSRRARLFLPPNLHPFYNHVPYSLILQFMHAFLRFWLFFYFFSNHPFCRCTAAVLLLAFALCDFRCTPTTCRLKKNIVKTEPLAAVAAIPSDEECFIDTIAPIHMVAWLTKCSWE